MCWKSGLLLWKGLNNWVVEPGGSEAVFLYAEIGVVIELFQSSTNYFLWIFLIGIIANYRSPV